MGPPPAPTPSVRWRAAGPPMRRSHVLGEGLCSPHFTGEETEAPWEETASAQGHWASQQQRQRALAR